jgi:N-acyl-D-aspartate/D-glutamate deacylase
MFDLALADPDSVFHWTNETPAWRTLLRDVQQHPQMLAGVSDGGAHLDFDDGAEWSTHFLATWWRDEGVWRLEDAIRRITAIPAAVLGLTDRGLLQPGRPADVFVFDPQRLALGRRRKSQDRVTGTARFRSSAVGVRATVVNGTVVVDDGDPTGALPGQVVRPS